MRIDALPFGVVDWSQVETSRHAGQTGEATWRTRRFGDLRLRLVDYSPGYRADHWCTKGHFLLCLEGELETELADGRRFTLLPGQMYHVADGAEPHRSTSRSGARLYVVD
jgi:quercetin dioxygenase-like cupin family protein